jgi:hypothetical protein
LREEDLAAIVDAGDPIRYSPGEVVAIAQPTTPATAFYLVRTGEVLLLPLSVQLPASITEVDVNQAEQLAAGRLLAGGLYNEAVLCAPAAPLQAHLVARSPGTVVICFELASITRALGAPGELEHNLKFKLPDNMTVMHTEVKQQMWGIALLCELAIITWALGAPGVLPVCLRWRFGDPLLMHLQMLGSMLASCNHSGVIRMPRWKW